ncbi:Receptor-type tyrosine-protein phosphatase T [Rhizoctonia solani]|uniref:Receptor-type tyrosine-protein phosphatase T n=1 Tax=Rhizoctonia solani TaxID=456999 RepID=A0A0K6FQX8_9AGAM|nr:Receptor-type tyrosine-protein phosphatase T [Rhizoctonia solani]
MKGGSTKAPPRKRQRTEKKLTRRKQGRLADFMNLPTDVFIMIASYLLPLDILSLARSNKFFNNLLMTKSSKSIWSNAMKNIPGLPPCPAELNEPQYVALLFTNVCSMCGSLSRSPVDEMLLVRLCAVCKRDELMFLRELPKEVHELVHYSVKSSLGETFPEMIQYLAVAVRGEAEAVLDKFNDLVDDEDGEAFRAWVAQRKRHTAKRRKWAAELVNYLATLEAQRADEKKELIETREAQIKERLLKLGWEPDDLKFHPYADGIQQWHELVENPKQPRPLTDRGKYPISTLLLILTLSLVWKNLYVKLEPLLEANRESRLEKECANRQIYRRNALDNLLLRIKHKNPVLLKVKPRKSKPLYSYYDSRPVAQRDVFPFVQDALELPFIKEMNEDDVSVDEFRKALDEHQSEIETFVAEWQDQTRTHLVDLIRAEDKKYPELLQPPKNMDPEAFARLSDDQKLLLRADSLFYVDGGSFNSSIKSVYGYEKALRVMYPRCTDEPLEPWDPCEPEEDVLEVPDLDMIHRYPAAQKVARELLADLGKPNASFVEINQVLYSCERCHEKEPKEWTSMIAHYLEQNQISAKVERHPTPPDEYKLVYNNVHARGFYTDRPMIRPVKQNETSQTEVPVRKCKLCMKQPVSRSVTLSAEKMNKHLLEIHWVTRPELNEHYCIPASRALYGAQPGYGYERSKPQLDDEEVEADNNLEEEIEVRVVYYQSAFEDDEDEDEEGSDGSEETDF